MGYRIVKMSRQLFEIMFTQGWQAPDSKGQIIRCIKGLPEGAKLEAVSMHVFFDTDDIALKFSHPSWPNEPGLAIPRIPVEFAIEVPDYKPSPELKEAWDNLNRFTNHQITQTPHIVED